MSISELIKALEAADGPSRELDVAIDMTLWPNKMFMPSNPDPLDWVVKVGDIWSGVYRDGSYMTNSDRYCRRYTYSVDAAIALCNRVLPEAKWEITTTGFKPGCTIVSNGRMIAGSYSLIPAIALCLAVLRAKLSQDGGGDE